MQTTTTTDQAEGEFPAERAKRMGTADSTSPDASAARHRLRSARRRKAEPAPAGDGGTSHTEQRRPRPDDLVGRLRRVRMTQAGFDGETRMRRLLTAVLLSELVLVIVLAAAQAWIGLIVALVATIVVVAAIMIFGPHDETALPGGDSLDHVVAGQKEELVSLRQRAAAAEASVSLLAELAGRHRALLVRQLTQIDQLEAKEADPGALGELFALDHLATRMRRCSEGVLLLSGRDEQRSVGTPVPASEVLRGAVAEVEDFSRVEVSLDRDTEVAGAAVVDIVHLLAELIENATVYSSPTTPVRVRGHVTGDAFAVTVTDQGVGIDADRLAELNRALASGDVPVTAGQVGFPVVARLAARQGVYVGLTTPADGGIEVTVVLPSLLVGGQQERQGAPASLPPAAAPAQSTAPPPATAPASSAAAATAPVTYAPFPDEPAAEEAYPAAETYQPSEEPTYSAFEPSDEAPAYPEPVYAAEQTYQPWELPTEDAPTHDAPTYDAPTYDAPTYEAPAYELTPYEGADAPSYGESEDPLGMSAADLAEGGEPQFAWSLPAVAPLPQDVPSSWSEPSWREATDPAPFVPPVHVEDLAPAPLAPLPEPAPVAVPDPPVSTQPPAALPPPPVDAPETTTGLVRRIPLTNMAPQIAAPDHALADDVASQPTPDRSRHLFAAYRDGLTLGRGGLDDVGAGPDEDS